MTKSKKEQREERRRAARARSVTKTIVWVVAAVLVIGGAYVLMRDGDSGPETTLPPLPLDAADASDWAWGNPDANVVLIEYSDFQCPACRSYQPLVQQLQEEFSDDILFVYRHFPLRRIHLNAEAAARAAEAAGQQGAFWKMHDMLFERQSEWSRGSPDDRMMAYAESLGLDVVQFDQDYESDAVRDAIARDEESGHRAGVNATPTLLLNGERIQTPPNYDELRLLIQGAITDAE